MTFINAHRYKTTPGLWNKEVQPARIYVHNSYTFNPEQQLEEISQALELLVKTRTPPTRNGESKDMMYFIGGLWQLKNVPCLDIVGYGNFPQGNWQGNPEVISWNIIDLNVRWDWPGFACEEEMILFGKEAQLRRTTPDLATYIDAPFIDLP